MRNIESLKHQISKLNEEIAKCKNEFYFLLLFELKNYNSA